MFARLLARGAEDIDVVTMTSTLNTAVTETASGVIGKHCPKEKPRVTGELLDIAITGENLR